MCASIAPIAKAVAGLIDLIQSAVAAREKDQEIAAGVAQEQVKQATTKEHDEAIAKAVDAQPTPADKHVILDWMRPPDGSPGR